MEVVENPVRGEKVTDGCGQVGGKKGERTR